MGQVKRSQLCHREQVEVKQVEGALNGPRTGEFVVSDKVGEEVEDDAGGDHVPSRGPEDARKG